MLLDHADGLLDGSHERSLLDELSHHALVLLTAYNNVQLPNAAQLQLKGLAHDPNPSRMHPPSEALQLLLDRTQRAIGRSSVPPEWWPELTAISDLVAGVPWWLELAAHQLSFSSPEEVLQRLRTTPWTLELDLLDVPERRRSPLKLAQEIMSGQARPETTAAPLTPRLRQESTSSGAFNRCHPLKKEQPLLPPLLHAVMQQLCS